MAIQCLYMGQFFEAISSTSQYKVITGVSTSQLQAGFINPFPNLLSPVAYGKGTLISDVDASGSCPSVPYPSYQFFAGYLDTTSPLGVPGTMSAIPIQSLMLVIALFFAVFLGFKTGFRP